MKIYIGSDHAGFALKKSVIAVLTAEGVSLDDCGCHSEESCDYPTFAESVGRKVVAEKTLGILVCGSGLGVAIAANKVRGVRAASVTDATAARLSREHNDANIISFGSRLIGAEVALDVCRAFVKAKFQGGRHQKRVDLISAMEKNFNALDK
ncbi:MAG: ribose 5-phosphate isomerase B [Deltaproteobacteria bacterium]|nr:ribose 5-phosphate isomerase B [Deltaproteobacteria bacterium]MBI3294322.1 ribose 5-phosphate isomerase B [Deltaproteobacteria bacterium]